jgi:hypothetical protein
MQSYSLVCSGCKFCINLIILTTQVNFCSENAFGSFAIIYNILMPVNREIFTALPTKTHLLVDLIKIS